MNVSLQSSSEFRMIFSTLEVIRTDYSRFRAPRNSASTYPSRAPRSAPPAATSVSFIHAPPLRGPCPRSPTTPKASASRSVPAPACPPLHRLPAQATPGLATPSARRVRGGRRRAQVTTLVKGISAEEYDAAVARTPKLCPLFVMGDRRGGRELLNDTARDRAVCLARWPNSCSFLHKPRQM